MNFSRYSRQFENIFRDMVDDLNEHCQWAAYRISFSYNCEGRGWIDTETSAYVASFTIRYNQQLEIEIDTAGGRDVLYCSHMTTAEEVVNLVNKVLSYTGHHFK